MTALRILPGDARYDVVIVDNDLPGLSGLELARRVRKITHRRKTPIIMLSGDEIETEAWRAGVKEFLRKPGRHKPRCILGREVIKESKSQVRLSV